MAEQDQAAAQPQFVIEKIYVKDASLEIPNAPEIFLERAQPELEFSFRNEGKAIGNDYHEVVLTATVTAKLKDSGKKTVFLIEASQGGIFMVKRCAPEPIMELVYAITCPTILLPYLRETVSDMAVRAGFPPVFLAPMNFEALYRQRQQAEGQAAPERRSTETSSHSHSSPPVVWAASAAALEYPGGGRGAGRCCTTGLPVDPCHARFSLVEPRLAGGGDLSAIDGWAEDPRVRAASSPGRKPPPSSQKRAHWYPSRPPQPSLRETRQVETAHRRASKRPSVASSCEFARRPPRLGWVKVTPSRWRSPVFVRASARSGDCESHHSGCRRLGYGVRPGPARTACGHGSVDLAGRTLRGHACRSPHQRIPVRAIDLPADIAIESRRSASRLPGTELVVIATPTSAMRPTARVHGGR